MEVIGHGFLDPIQLDNLEFMERKALLLLIMYLMLEMGLFLGLIVMMIFGYLVVGTVMLI